MVANRKWLPQIPTVRRPLSHKVYTLGGLGLLFAPNGIKKLLAIGTMPKSAAVATRKGDHEAPRF